MACNRFALVIRSPGGDHPKFLCDSPPHTVMAVAAFEKNAHLLSDGMRRVAGCNLRDAALLYGVRPPAGVSLTREVDSNLVVGKLPEEQVKEASAPDLEDCLRQARWFDDYGYSLDPRQRREFAEQLSGHLLDHHLPPRGDLAKYAGEGFGAEFRGGLGLRRGYLGDRPDEVEALRVLDQVAQDWGPVKVAEALWALDERCGLTHLWNRNIPDPYRTVFADSFRAFDKVAEDPTALRVLAHERELRDAFGAQFYVDLVKSPEVVLGALPLPDREVFDNILGV